MKKKVMFAILLAALALSMAACGEASLSSIVDQNVSSSQPSTADNTQTINSAAPTSQQAKQNEFLPLEVKESGYGMSEKYMYYAVVLHNPNTNLCVRFPSFRITARDENGMILGSSQKTLAIMYPQQDIYDADLAFKVEEIPTTIEIEPLTPEDYNLINTALLEHPEYKPLDIINPVVRDGHVMGEIKNSNDYKINQAKVVIVFRDENGKLTGGDLTLVEDISPNGSVPFDISVTGKDLVTNDYEVYAYTQDYSL